MAHPSVPQPKQIAYRARKGKNLVSYFLFYFKKQITFEQRLLNHFYAIAPLAAYLL